MSLFFQRPDEKTRITTMYGTALNTTKSSGNNNRQPPPAPTNANAAAAAAAAVETERPALPEDSDQRSMAGGNDHAEVVLPPSGLDKVRDVDGVQLMARRLSDSSHSIIRGRGGETDTDDDDVKAQSTGAERLRSTSESPRKMLVHEVDPMHYRKLVKGLIPIRSSLMRANIGNSTTDVQHRKSVHFSDQDGYYLSHVRSFDKPVRTTNKLYKFIKIQFLLTDLYGVAYFTVALVLPMSGVV